MKTFKQLLSENFKLIIVFSILIIYYEWRLYNKRCFTTKHIKGFQNRIEIQRRTKDNTSYSEKQTLFLELNTKLNGLLRFGNEYQNFVNSIISRESKSNSIELDDQQIETFRDLNNAFNLEINSLASQISEWREDQLNAISKQIQENIESIQSPAEENCKNITKIYCAPASFGFGSQIHGLMTCLLKGYYTKTMVVIDQIFFNYLKGSNSTWDQFISPISQTCQPNHSVKYDIRDQDLIITYDFGITTFLPEGIGQTLSKLHADPKAFWFGQFIKYIFRSNKYMDDLKRNAEKKLGLPQLYVGIQIRRGDKVRKEANSHGVEEYMFYVINYFDKLKLERYSGDKFVFVASDDENVIKELNHKYNDFKFIDSKQYFTNIELNNRQYSSTNLLSTTIDIHFLSKSDFLVCTMSSNLCQLAYELMQTYRPNSVLNYKSLDLPFIFHEAKSPDKQFKYNHKVKSNNIEFDIKSGDIIQPSIDFNNMAKKGVKTDGFFEGSLESTNNLMKNFRFPLYKTIEKYSFIDNEKQYSTKYNV